MVTKLTYRPPAFNKGKRKSQTQPDQSMSIRTIIERFTRGVSINAVRREGVYIDDDLDLEKVSRMDFAEKAELSEAIKARLQQAQADANERERLRNEEKQSESEAAEASEKQSAKKPAKPAKKGSDEPEA